MTAADFQRDKLPDDAIPFSERQPGPYEYVLGWISDPDVGIHHWPAVVWRDCAGEWWSGVPGKYLNLQRLRWKITHWRPIKPSI